ncbi:hypothetical protein [Nioella sp.]|uniref:hypothetical protein n=1 Tax=Nioella sp. TaxID=1912091 RepID=UPI003B517F89
MTFKSVLFFAILALMPMPAHAQSEPDLTEIVALWLSGNDAESLPALSQMSQAGDRDAQLLLARIETGDLGPSPYRLSLPRETSRTLFRAVGPDDRFGRSWLAVAARSDDARAQALATADRPGVTLDRIAALHRLGEAQAAHHATQILALYGDAADRAALSGSGLVLEELTPYLDYLSGPPEPRGNGLAALRYITGLDADATDPDARGMAELLALGHGFGDTDPDNRWRGAVESWVMTSPHTAPIARLCHAACPEEDVPACAFALMSATGGYYEVIRLDSPLETVIPQADFLASRRAELMALRRAVLVRRETNLGFVAEWEEIAPLSVCAARMIIEERQNYGGLADG